MRCYLFPIDFLNITDRHCREGNVPNGRRNCVEGNKHWFVVPFLNDFDAQENGGEESKSTTDNPKDLFSPMANSIMLATKKYYS